MLLPLALSALIDRGSNKERKYKLETRLEIESSDPVGESRLRYRAAIEDTSTS